MATNLPTKMYSTKIDLAGLKRVLPISIYPLG